MSPEQLSGDKVDGRSDIYSLALVFYRTITDTLPFLADTAQETMIKRLTDEPIPLAQARPDASFPPALQKVMDKALARWPQDRYASAPEFAADAGRAIEGARGMATSADTEAKTQVVRPSDLADARTAAIPPTRVSSKARAKVSPVVVGAGVVLLALAGGGFVMRDTLFGTGSAGTPTDTSQVVAPGDSVQRFSQQGGEGPFTDPDTPVVRPAGTQNPPRDPGSQTRDTGRSRDPGTQTNPGSTSPANDLGSLDTEVTSMEDGVLDTPELRGNIARRADVIYRNQSLPARVRSRAAFINYLVNYNERRFDQARSWIDRATALNPTSSTYARADTGLKKIEQPPQ
jgi:hypothetical protein